MNSKKIAEKLSYWFGQNARDLPWRKEYLPYEVLISEVILQQTQIKTALPFYEKWLISFPNLKALSSANLAEVMNIWQGLGYYARAKNLHKLAKVVTNQFSGEIPNNFNELIQLPGIGSYSAGAIASISFNQKVPAIDGNVRRVFSRLFAFSQPINTKKSEVFFTKKANDLLDYAKARIINQALMEMGALICTPKNPNCSQCPIIKQCAAYQNNSVSLFPQIKKTQYHKTTLLFLICLSKREEKIALTISHKKDLKQAKILWWNNLYSLPYLQFKNHLSFKQLLKKVTRLNQVNSSIKLIFQNSFGISNHKVRYYLLQVSESWLKTYFKKHSNLEINYFKVKKIEKLAMSAQSRKLIKIAQNS